MSKKCKAVQTFAINPAVIRCACGAKVTVYKGGEWSAHLNGINPGESFPWAGPARDVWGEEL